MADIQNLKDLRAAIRPLGYGIKTKRLSWGPHATFFLLADESHALTYDVFTPELLRLWTPLFDFLREHSEAIGRIRKIEGIYGLNVCSKREFKKRTRSGDSFTRTAANP